MNRFYDPFWVVSAINNRKNDVYEPTLSCPKFLRIFQSSSLLLLVLLLLCFLRRDFGLGTHNCALNDVCAGLIEFLKIPDAMSIFTNNQQQKKNIFFTTFISLFSQLISAAFHNRYKERERKRAIDRRFEMIESHNHFMACINMLQPLISYTHILINWEKCG